MHSVLAYYGHHIWSDEVDHSLDSEAQGVAKATSRCPSQILLVTGASIAVYAKQAHFGQATCGVLLATLSKGGRYNKLHPGTTRFAQHA